MECKALKPIHTVALRLGSRVCEWRPYPHWVTTHGDKRTDETACGAIVDTDIRPDGSGTHVCRACGPIPEAVAIARECPGVGPDIR